ncbi:DNA polymerase III subunit delta', partial [bacterium AH-315-J04]|nr:DNA polymerase III subunit delta' [bacterium AH-315-J04]
MPLADIRHQNHAHRQVQRAISQGRLAHAYIFHGPDGVGKEMFARALAQRLLCDEPTEAALEQSSDTKTIQQGCGECQECVAVTNNTHPDIHSIYRQLIREHPDSTLRKRKALELGVDVIRHFIIDKASFTPLRGKIKIFIIREADRITVAAQNALLKTLEEPPGATLIILLATDLSRLLPTTLSRCQVLTFNPLPDDFVRQTLSESQPDLSPERANWYARIAGGSMGIATIACADNHYDINTKLIDQLVSLNAQTSSGISRAWIEESKSMSSLFRQRDPDI